MEIVLLWKFCLAGLALGSIYAIVAIGFNIIYNTTGIINFAQGEFVILGAMLAISFLAWMPLAAAIALAVLLTMLVGALIEIVFIRWLKDASVLRMVIITIGVSIVLREAMLHVWDEKVHALPSFSGTSVSSIAIFGASCPPQYLWVFGTGVVIVAGLSLFFKCTTTGRAMRACASNRTAARLCGINAKGMVTLSFMLSAGIGALAGCVTSPITSTQYDMGAPLAIKGFAVAILGGLGNSAAAVGAGLLVGVLESLSVYYVGSTYQDAIAVAILLVILICKPSGLFGSREASALKEF
jgi:branched-chain amino acid transport system permease protein